MQTGELDKYVLGCIEYTAGERFAIKTNVFYPTIKEATSKAIGLAMSVGTRGYNVWTIAVDKEVPRMFALHELVKKVRLTEAQWMEVSLERSCG